MTRRYRSLVQRTAGLLQRRRYCEVRDVVASATSARPLALSPESSALAGKPLREVVRSWIVFKLLGFDWIVRHSLTLYNVSTRLLGAGVTRRLLRATVGGQFLGGFSEEEAKAVAQLVASRKMCSIWSFSTEQDLSDGGVELTEKEARFDEVNSHYLRTICLSGEYNYQESPVKMAAIKLTAIVDPHILLKLSRNLEAVQDQMHQQGLGELTEAGERRRMEVARRMSGLKVGEGLGVLEEASQFQVDPWTASEREQLARLISRLDAIGECAVRECVGVLVDAEESRLQSAVHHITLHHLMPRYNSTRPLIYNTIQMYRKNSLEALLIDIATAKTTGFSYAVKLVRGAYMYYEKGISEETGREHPIHPSKKATDANYDRGVGCLMEELARGTPEAGVGAVVIASHNKLSVERAVEKMEALRLPHDTGAVCFGQQLGMADYISYALAERGYIVQKHMPHGEDKDVIPFLVRRAHENDKTSENAQVERQLYGEELRRRLRK